MTDSGLNSKTHQAEVRAALNGALNAGRRVIVGLLVPLAILTALAVLAPQSALAMAGATNCSTCHAVTYVTHPVIRCALCHTDGQEGFGYRAFSDGYGEHAFTCVECHSPTYPGVPQHTTAAVDAVHQTSTAGCDQCHAVSLLSEHEKYPASGVKYDCTVCHSSATPSVVMAIANNQTACDACHTGGGHANHDADLSDAACITCHSAGIMGIHGTCDTCHSTAPPAGATCSTCHPANVPAHGTNLTPAGAYQLDYYGYVSWGWAQDNEASNGSSPHGNYTTSTNKCAVCHSVHKASATGKVLTAWTGYTATGTNMDPYQSCMWCHGTSSPLFAVSTIGNAATLSPHGYCGRCHTASVHGAGGSVYPALKAKMLNTGGDADIAIDSASIIANVGVDMTTNLTAGAVAVGTGYLCGDCHESSQLALPVTALGQVPAKGGVAAGSVVTGHKIIAAVSSTWNENGSKGAYYSGMVDGVSGDSQVAFNPADGCKSCHDARFGDQTSGQLAFPHNYVNSAGAVAAKTTLGSSYVWLTTGANSTAARTVAGKTQTGSGDSVGTEDGLCLKCHRSGNGVSGVGQTF